MAFGVSFTEKICPIANVTEDPEDLRLVDPSGRTVPLHVVGWLVSLIFTLQSSIVTLYLIKQHLKYYHKPTIQRYIVRLLLIVPSYTILNWLAYFFIRYSIYFSTIRDAYQAYAIISFFNLLLYSLGDNDDERRKRLRQIKIITIPFPFCCLSYNSRGHRILLKRFGILQYVFIVYATMFVALVLQAIGKYCKESFSIYFPQIYLVIIRALSGFIANICMNMLFQPVQQILSHDHPWVLRNICVNTALFLVTYQGYLIGIFIFLGYIRETKHWTADDISTGIQTLLVSVEFSILSLIQMKAFRYKDYRPDPRETTPILPAMRDSLIPTDLFKDFKYAIKYIYYRISNKPFSKLPPNDTPSPEAEKGIWDYFSTLFRKEEKPEEDEGKIFYFCSFQIVVKKKDDNNGK